MHARGYGCDSERAVSLRPPPAVQSGRRSLALPTEVPRSCDRYRMTCQRTRTPLAQALLHQEIPGLRSRRRHSCTDHSVAHVCASASVPRSYRVSHMLGSGSPHPVLTPTPPVIQAVASLQSRDASRRCRQLPAKFVRCCSARPKAKPLVAPLDMAASGSSGGNAGALQLLPHPPSPVRRGALGCHTGTVSTTQGQLAADARWHYLPRYRGHAIGIA